MSHTVVYTHTYNYERSWGVYRPIMPVELYYGQQRWPGTALLDSGAEYPTFDVRVAALRGTDLTKLPKDPLSGLSGDIDGYRQNLGLKLGPLLQPITCRVYFVDRPYIRLIGRLGVFSRLQIGFDEANRQIYMALNP